MKLKLYIITITYKPTKVEVFKCAKLNSDNEIAMNNLDYIYPPFDIIEDDRKFAVDNGCMYDNYMNAEGFDELYRFISYVEDCDFFDIKYSTKDIEV